ncbi:MAG: hypothetical protein HQL56_15600, partial [Magnetococcales bacterium]|nr:hypothetical protein [Magnetococcales bacterium]
MDPQRRLYVDYRVQMAMVVALVLLQILLIVLGSLWLYHRFSQILESHLYRVHQGGLVLGEAFQREALWVVVGLVVVNLLAVAVADRIWRGYVRRVLGTLGELCRRTRQGEFDSDERIDPDLHPVIHWMVHWRALERARQRKLKRLLDTLDHPADFKSHDVCLRHQVVLSRLRQHLPRHSLRY